MPINIPLPAAARGYAQPVNSEQPGFGTVTTLIHPFFTNVGYGVTSSIGTFNYWGSTATAITKSISVADYNNHSFQGNIAGSGSFTSSMVVQSSIDGYNWTPEFTFTATTNTGSVNRFTGRRGYFQAALSSSGNVTSSLYLISGE